MTEQEWLACRDITKLICGYPLHSGPRVNDRTLRLLTIATLRPLADHLMDERSRQAFKTLEWYVEGTATREELIAAAEAAHAAVDSGQDRADQAAAEAVAIALDYDRPSPLGLGWPWDDGPDAAIGNARSNYQGVAYHAALAITVARLGIGKGYERFQASVQADLARQADVLRDVLGNPFRPVSGNPAWLTPTVKSLASGIYEEHAFDRMPVLADALEEAGCIDHDMLAHCRTPGLHVRGCWVLDLILEQEVTR